jgi:hypothetical protein
MKKNPNPREAEDLDRALAGRCHAVTLSGAVGADKALRVGAF